MTIREFIQKYQIPYHVAYEATYKVKPVSTMIRDRDYQEDELYKAVVEMLAERIDRHKRIIHEQRTFLNNMRCKDEMSEVQQRKASSD